MGKEHEHDVRLTGDNEADRECAVLLLEFPACPGSLHTSYRLLSGKAQNTRPTRDGCGRSPEALGKVLLLYGSKLG